ncbi:hypothetical protein [Photobacterium carnosum]|uniref:hypothetical protein n=1 Tax=Photobacterium carnosum TaxID=2023717 RepID=UPI001E2B1A8D|nr:hypothetical protein [Photobacterium carnosum]MCD9516411.1 hypothetical protein [Photobacterium carnosum]
MSNSWPQQPDDDLRIDTAWRENYSGASMNQKLHGIVNKGVYSGFKVTPTSGLSVEISGLGDQNIAIIEVGTYSLTARMPKLSKKQLGVVATGTVQYVVLEAMYARYQESTVKLLVKETINSDHVVIATLNVPLGATRLTSEMITHTYVAKSVTQSEYAELAALVVDNSSRQMNMDERLRHIESLHNI